ncbi:hypothetical protein OG968_23025 [Streptomyces althioticus]|uniref:hypothetical protein n=1 Tax=Streptomyces althioticus TaxID=83380 RepID=UPI0038738164|nr:hypothetical protein OG968_23025 [Streptomyces althioticus]
MATPRRLTLECSTCGGPHPHRLLNREEEAAAKRQLGLRATYDFWICENVVDTDTGAQCRTMRRYVAVKPFPKPVKLLPPD